MHRLLCIPALFALTACGTIGASPGARAQEAVNETNLNARFGRMEMAAEHVHSKAREAFFDKRKGWGGKVRVVDYEVAGMKMNKDESEADVFVKVAWFRVDEGDLRNTTLKQKWHDYHTDWKLTDESRADGDVGLLGENVERVAAPDGPRNAQFPTIRLGNTPVTGQ